MKIILTPEDKKYLRFYGKYIQSYGEKETTFRIDDWNPDYTDIHDGRLHADENYYLDIPERITPIIRKISESLSDYEPNYESDDVGSTWADFKIDSQDNSVHVEFCYSYFTRDEQGMSWDEVEISADDTLSKIMDELRESNVPYMSVKFDGNGDSGSIEGAEDEDGAKNIKTGEQLRKNKFQWIDSFYSNRHYSNILNVNRKIWLKQKKSKLRH